jgi:hypothetical protein
MLAILTFGAPALGLGAIALSWLGWRGFQAGPIRAPPGAGLAAAGVIVFFGALFLLPGWLFMAAFAMVIPGSIAGVIVYKMRETRRAAAWPSAQGRITRSQPRAVRRKQADGSNTVSNAPDIEYVFSVDGAEYRGHRISIGDIAPGSPEVEAALDNYRVGRTGPVFYNPADPKEAVLERNPPASPRVMYAIAAGVTLVGLAVVTAFSRISEIIDWLQPFFPPGAVVQGVLFCGAAGVLMALFLLSDHREAMAAARWPSVTGKIIASRAESRKELTQGGGSQTMTVWSPLVEYSYRVNERDYHGARIAFGASVSAGRAFAETIIARYPNGSAVTVYYDPSNPSFAVLEPRIAFALRTLLVMVAFFAAAVFFSGWRG